MKLKVVISLLTAPSKQPLTSFFIGRCYYLIHKSVFFSYHALSSLCAHALANSSCLLKLALFQIYSALLVSSVYKHFLLVEIGLNLFIKCNKSPGNCFGDIYAETYCIARLDKNHSGTTGPPILRNTKQAIDRTNQSAFIYLLL